jgi:sugar O-acyltransferase (sialic acid O-acetyltransferase NeuD family)
MNLFIYCAGGFGKEMIDTATRINKYENKWDEICFIDDSVCFGDEFYGRRLFSFDKVLKKFDLNGFEVSVANGEPSVRKAIYGKLRLNKIKLASLVDNTAIVSDTAKMGEGIIITEYCSVSSSAEIGNNSAIYFKSIVGHDVRVGEHCVVSSLVGIGGGCSIGENSYIGMGAQIKEGLVIGKDVILGIGSVVHNDIPDGVIALGNPARPMRRNVDKKIFNKSKKRGEYN